MRREVGKSFDMTFARKGGAVIEGRVDVWRAEANQWTHILQMRFEDPLQPSETVKGQLEAGEYTCIFRGVIEESLNGRFAYELDVGGVSTFADSGDVNITSSDQDFKVLKDQFILGVT